MLVAAVFIGVLSLINFRGIKESVKLNLGLTRSSSPGSLLMAAIGARVLLDGGGEPAARSSSRPATARCCWRSLRASLAFFALIGFEDSVNVAEETRNPGRAFPPALFVGLGIAARSTSSVTSSRRWRCRRHAADSDGPLLEVVQVGPLAMNPKVFSAIALFALSNSALINMIMASRLMYGMSRRGIVSAVVRARARGGARRRWRSCSAAPWPFVLVVIGDLETWPTRPCCSCWSPSSS